MLPQIANHINKIKINIFIFYEYIRSYRITVRDIRNKKYGITEYELYLVNINKFFAKKVLKENFYNSNSHREGKLF